MIHSGNPKQFVSKPHIPTVITRRTSAHHLYYGIELELEAKYPNYSKITKKEYNDFVGYMGGSLPNYNEFSEMIQRNENELTYSQAQTYSSYKRYRKNAHLTALSDELIKLYSNKEDRFHCKYEGTVQYGFELVTQPMNFALQKLLFHKMKHYLRDKFLTGHQTDDRGSAGLHVHINKSYLSDDDKMKLAIFMNRQNRIVYAIGRREDSEWSERYNVTRDMVERGDYRNGHGDRANRTAFYSNYSATMEFRCFKSTNEWRDVIVALQFIRTIIDFTRMFKPLELYDMGWDDERKAYLKFLGSVECPCNRQYLMPYLQENGFDIPN